MIADRHTITVYGLKTDGRKIHRVHNAAGFQKAHQLIGRHDRTVFFRLIGASTQVWGQHDPWVIDQTRYRKIRDIAAKVLTFKRGLQCCRIHNRLTREIKQYAAGFKCLQGFGIDHALGGGQLGYM